MAAKLDVLFSWVLFFHVNFSKREVP